jgi:hypothetical protein
VLLPSTVCGGIRPTDTADGGYLRLPTEEQYLIYKQSLPTGYFHERQHSTLTMTIRSLGLFQHMKLKLTKQREELSLLIASFNLFTILYASANMLTFLPGRIPCDSLELEPVEA